MHPSPRFLRLLAVFTTAVSLLLVPALKANLLTGNEAQLEAWLGQGNLDFTSIYATAVTTGATPGQFHGNADGQGPTFTLMRISGTGGHGDFDLPSQIIGGYNPQSWASDDGIHKTGSNAERTAFIYNLTSGTIQRQNLDFQGYQANGVSSGESQTLNTTGYGPTFGGDDIKVFANWGYAYNFHYGGTSYADEIVLGGPNFFDGGTHYSYFFVDAIEVYTFAPAQNQDGGNGVPDTAGTLGLLSATLIACAALRRRLA